MMQRRQAQKRLLPPLLLAAAVLAVLGPRAFGPSRRGSSAAGLGRTAVAMQAASAAAEETSEKLSEFAELRVEQMEKAQSKISRWEKTSNEGRTIMGFGSQATRLLNKTLTDFDARAKQVSGPNQDAERKLLDSELQRRLHSVFLVQRSTIEEALYQRLKRELLARMRRKRRELEVKEKLRLLHAAMKDYDSQVRELQPAFVQDPERDRAERRLSELQFGILDTPEGKEMQQRWKMDRMRRMPMRQSRGISISLSPGMRLMFRPGGLGNLQVSSKRQVGPPHNPNEVSIGMLNDGNVIDVYNSKPSPPLIKFQPTVAVDLSLG